MSDLKLTELRLFTGGMMKVFKILNKYYDDSSVPFF